MNWLHVRYRVAQQDAHMKVTPTYSYFLRKLLIWDQTPAVIKAALHSESAIRSTADKILP